MPSIDRQDQVTSERETRERALIAGLAIVGILCILTALWMEPGNATATSVSRTRQMGLHLLRDLGIALVIASALAFAVDKYLKAKLVSAVATRVSQHVAENTSKYVFGYLVPPDLRDELLELMRPAVLRRNFKLRIQIEYMGADHTDFVRVTTRVGFTLENLKDEEISFRHSLSMTNMFPDIERPAVVRFACRGKSRDVYEYDYEGFDSLLNTDNGRLRIARSEDGRELAVHRIVQIPPLSKEFEFRTESTEVMKVPYSDQFCFANATCFIEVETNCPKDMDVLIELEKGREVQIYKDPPNHPTYWRYSGICLAGQHVTYKFRRRTPSN